MTVVVAGSVSPPPLRSKNNLSFFETSFDSSNQGGETEPPFAIQLDFFIQPSPKRSLLSQAYRLELAPSSNMLVRFQFRSSFGLHSVSRPAYLHNLKLSFGLLITDCLPSSHLIESSKKTCPVYLHLLISTFRLLLLSEISVKIE